MRDAAAMQILAELARRRPVVAVSQQHQADEAATLLRAFYYPKQNAFFTSKHRRKATSKTRRAGATAGGVREILARCVEHPNYRVTVVHSTKQEARARAWLSDTQSGFVDILRQFGTPVDHPSLEVVKLGGVTVEIRDQVMQLDFSNGSQVCIFGFDDERAMRKQRGLAKHLYWIDEAQDIRFLEGFYNKVVMAQQDYDCEVWLSGTPGQDCAGMFYDITKEEDDGPRLPGWEVHTIAQIDNPFWGHVVGTFGEYYVEDNLKQKYGPYASYLEAEAAAGQVRWDVTAGNALKDRGWKGDEPDFIREFLGKWCKQDARYVYPVHSVSPYNLLYAPQRIIKPNRVPVPIDNYVNHIDPMTGAPPFWCDFKKSITDLPKQKKFRRNRQWMYAIGADFGYHPDPFAIVVWAFAHDTQDVYELFSWKAQKVHTDDQGQYLLKVWTELDNVVCLVGDPAGKQDDFDVWRTRLNLPIDEANKKGKNTLEEFLADDIRRGRVHLRHDSPLYDEMKHLLYLPTKPGKTREAAKFRRAADGKIHGDHCCDAGRYAYEALSHYLSKNAEEKPDKGTTAALYAEEARIEQKLDAREKARAEKLAEGDELYLESIGEYDEAY
jgi:hypothetical protein